MLQRKKRQDHILLRIYFIVMYAFLIANQKKAIDLKNIF